MSADGAVGVKAKQPETVRGHAVVNGDWGRVLKGEWRGALYTEIKAASPQAGLLLVDLITMCGPRGRQLSYTELAAGVPCSTRHAQRLVTFVEKAGVVGVIRGGGRDCNRYFLVDNPPEHLPKGLTIGNCETWVDEGGAADVTPPAAPAPPSPSVSTDAAAAPASSTAVEPAEGEGTRGRFGPAIDQAAAPWVEPPPSPWLVDELAAVDEVMRQCVGGMSNGGLWQAIEAHGLAARPTPASAWVYAEEQAAARATGSPWRAAEELVVAFHELGLGRVGHRASSSELNLAKALLELQPERAWALVEAAIPRYQARMRKLGLPPDKARYMTFIRGDLLKLGAVLPDARVE